MRVLFNSLTFPALTLLCLFLGSCSSKPAPAPAVEALVPDQASLEPSHAQTPFSFEVVNELNDGKRLHIHGRVVAAAAWSPDDLVVRLTGLQAGEQRGVSYHPLSKLLASQSDGNSALSLAKDEPTDFYLSVPSAGLTDYQLELLWGKEAKAVIGGIQISSETPSGVILKGLNIRKDVRSCTKPPCSASYRIAGQIFNSADDTVEQVQLGVGFIWVPAGSKLDLSTQIPQDEEHVDITGLNLAASQERRFDLTIDRAVPELEGGQFQPVVRVVSFR